MSGLFGSCVSDGGYIASSEARSSAIHTQAVVDGAIQTIIALYQRNASQSITNIQTNLSNQQVALAEEVEAHAEGFWPAEKALVDQVFGIAKKHPTYNTFMSVYGAVAAEELDAAHTEWLDTMATLGEIPSDTDDIRWQRNAIAIEVDLRSYGARQEENRDQLFNDRRYAYQLAVLGLGRGATADLVSFEGTAAMLATGGAEVLEAGIGRALALFGYEENTHPGFYGWSAGVKAAGRTPPAQGATMSLPPGWRDEG